jgi:hypothetical protein
MQLPLTSSFTTHGHAVFPFAFSRLLDRHGGRLDLQQPDIADRVRPRSARRAAASPASTFRTSGGRVHVHLH